jgi:hypothetical protein
LFLVVDFAVEFRDTICYVMVTQHNGEEYMKIDAIKFRSSDKSISPEKTELTLTGIENLQAMKAESLPFVYIVKRSTLETFRTYKDLIEDRGTKHARVDLSRILLGKSRIPIVDGSSFESPHQLGRSVRTLLGHAMKEKDRNFYIVGVDPDLFDRLVSSTKEPLNDESAGYCISGSGNISSDSQCFPDSTLKLMKKEDTSQLRKAFIGESKEAEFVRRLILRASDIDIPVLIIGDSGTGKEIVAQQIHKLSQRSGKFRPVNCGAFPGDLLESELFGHKKGAFSGACFNKKGLWEEAKDGTLFLDEIGDLSLNHQAKILRAIEEGKIRRVGENDEVTVNARIIAATNRDLFALTEDGQFREDLYYRLRYFYIPTPPLRDHPSDVPLLADFLWQSITKGARPPLSGEIMSFLQEYPWPGNVRELKSILAQLNGMFIKEEILTVEHVTEIFKMKGQLWGRGKKGRAISAHEKPCSRVECLLHLRRVFEVVLATSLTLKDIFEGKGSNSTIAVGQRIEELDLLCLYPLRFHKEELYVQVNSLRSKVFYLYNLLNAEGPEAALDCWKKSVQDEIDTTISVLLHAIEEISEVKG